MRLESHYLVIYPITALLTSTKSKWSLWSMWRLKNDNEKWEKWYFKTLDCLYICLEDIGGILQSYDFLSKFIILISSLFTTYITLIQHMRPQGRTPKRRIHIYTLLSCFSRLECLWQPYLDHPNHTQLQEQVISLQDGQLIMPTIWECLCMNRGCPRLPTKLYSCFFNTMY